MTAAVRISLTLVNVLTMPVTDLLVAWFAGAMVAAVSVGAIRVDSVVVVANLRISGAFVDVDAVVTVRIRT